jgi:hypothetical protein
MTQRAGDGNRTRDPELGRLVLCQLSYSRASGWSNADDGEGRIRTSEGVRRQIYSLLPLAARAPLRILPGCLPGDRCRRIDAWSRWSESNRRPADYKSAALPPELHRQAAPRFHRRAVCQPKQEFWESRRERSRGAPPPQSLSTAAPESDEAMTDNIGARGCQRNARFGGRLSDLP